jgi:hypothetical protein
LIPFRCFTFFYFFGADNKQTTTTETEFNGLFIGEGGWGGEKINDANEKLETKQINKWIEESRANLDSMMCTIFYILMMIGVLLLISFLL